MPGWTVLYEANKIPQSADPPWSLTTSVGSATVEIVSGALHVLCGAGATRRWTRTFSAVTPVTLAFRVRAVAGVFAVTAVVSDPIQVGNGLAKWAAAPAQQYAIDTTVDHIYRWTLTDNGATWTIKLYVDEGDVAVFTATLTSGADLDLLRLHADGSDTEWYLDYFYYSFDGAFSPSQLPLPSSGGASGDFCLIPQRMNTIVSGRTAFGFITKQDGQTPARATSEAFVLDYLGQRLPIVWSFIDKAKVRMSGIGGHYRHEIEAKVQVVLEDLKQLKHATLGELAEDLRAAFNDGNIALNGLTDIEDSTVTAVRLLPSHPDYPRRILQADLRILMDRRYSDSVGTFTAGSTNPRKVALAIATRLDADADFDGITFYEAPPIQPSAWPAAWVEWMAHRPLIHPTHEHFPMRFKVVFQDYYTKQTRICRLLNYIRDLEDRIHLERTLNGEVGVHDWRLLGYEMRVRAGQSYLYDEAVAEVEVITDI